MERATRKGKRKISLINLNRPSTANPNKRKGSKMSQTNGKRKIISNASGQEITNSMHQRIKAINVRIECF